MKLIIAGGDPLEQPGPDRIAEELDKMDREAGEFAILERDESGEQFYMQCAGDRESGYVLEYREGGEDSHFLSKDVDRPLGAIIDAFQKYARDDSSWKSDHDWGQLSQGKSGCMGMVLFLLGTGAALGGMLA